ncbi:metallophosphoesterase family protein [Paenalkalicoccus suaedae]|uniref:Metallophosphoesterase family protein n=1 Tax=Paenalkalicoccus suaedae TaxID=2592382 RepID=A0A859FCJ0_9BACI|nr:metallophosphoesterase family protein [Paenalkalicoccus suaedae]QKS71063.1 metallophosphoesterase family protein [Paenalkalicoccus suaedae]
MIKKLIICFISLLIYMFIEAKWTKINYENYKIGNSNKKMNVLFLSDLHRRTISKRLLSKVGSVEAVFLAGDLAEKGVHKEQIVRNLQVLNQVAPVYFVWGNNDYEVAEEIHEALKETNSVELTNRSVKLGSFTLAGIGDLTSNKHDVKKALEEADGPVVLLSHNPDISFKLKGYPDVKLVLSGHTHGGQIRIGPYGIAERGGWKKRNGVDVFISNGHGTSEIPFRFMARAQIHKLTIYV